MTMKNLDMLDKERAEFAAKIHQAVKDDDDTAFAAAFSAWADGVQQQIMQDAQALVNQHDAAVLASRGVRQLTSEEQKYFQALGDALKSSNPKQALTELDVVLPKTTIDTIFDYLTNNYPLLSAIDFQNTGALIEILVATSGGVAGWGDLCAEIKNELNGSFAIIDLTLKKLSAFIPVCKAMLDLGPAWLDRFVRTILAEALALQLDAAIVDGDGDKKPIGMTRKLTGATDGVYPRKTTVKVDNLNPVTIGGILNTISKAPNNKRRPIPQLLMVVNPTDYFTKIFPATTVRATDGSYNKDVLPYPTLVVVSPNVPDDRAIFGLAKRYFFGLGTSKGGRIEYSDEYKFLEDNRVYLIKLYGNGQPLDENAFVLADISDLKPTALQVEIIGAVPEI